MRKRAERRVHTKDRTWKKDIRKNKYEGAHKKENALERKRIRKKAHKKERA